MEWGCLLRPLSEGGGSAILCIEVGGAFVFTPSMRSLPSLIYLLLITAGQFGLCSGTVIEGRVDGLEAESRSLRVELLKCETSQFSPSDKLSFRVSSGDFEIGYLGRRIRANANYYNKAWHLEQVFPLDGEGAEAVQSANQALRLATESMRRGKFLRKGDVVPDFGMIDQNGEFFRINDLRAKPYVLNFIFTRCAAPKMCPASSSKMAELQERARAAGLKDLHFVTISFDPSFDSPGILRTYAKGYGMELDNFFLLTGTQEVVDDLLKQFGILTIKEDGTINHTVVTLLVDAEGRIAYRKEGPSWKVEDFFAEAAQL